MWKLLDNHECIGYLPWREGLLQEGTQLARVYGQILFQDHQSQGALLPFRVWHGDDSCLSDRCVSNQGILQVDRADPLPARLDQVLETIRDLDVSFRIDCDHVSCSKPSFFRPLVRLFEANVTARDPGPAHL